jgi:hypothetical protein
MVGELKQMCSYIEVQLWLVVKQRSLSIFMYYITVVYPIGGPYTPLTQLISSFAMDHAL